MAKKKPVRETQNPVENKQPIAKPKEAPVQPPEVQAEVAPSTAPPSEEAIAEPKAETAGTVKKKARYVRERKKKDPETSEPETTVAKPAARTKTRAEQTMSKNVPRPPKEEVAHGPKSKFNRKR